MPTRVPADLIDVAVEDGHALDVRLFEELAAVRQLTGTEQAAVIALTPVLHAQWVAGNIDPDTATAVGTRLDYLLAIDLAAQACYGPGTAGGGRSPAPAPRPMTSVPRSRCCRTIWRRSSPCVAGSSSAQVVRTF